MLLYCKLLLNSISVNCINVRINIKTVQNFFVMVQESLMGQGLIIIEASQSHSRHTTRSMTFGQVISPTQRPVIDNTTPTTDKAMPPSRIQTCNPSK